MGFQDDDLLNLDQLADANQEQPKKGKITYARNFLLSLSDLELCKQLPDGFDKSIISEFHDAFHGSQEKARVSAGFETLNFRHADYSASPPTRRDANSYTRGSAGKWESRSRDGDSKSDRDSVSLSESGKQFGTHFRRPCQNSEHDGLLGSGSSPKLSGYTTGISVPKPRVTDQNHLNRSSTSYQPPRPYKAVPHNRSATSDLHNDETFGSSEMTNDDRTEEERKRRAEFELMRKERHKSSQNKQSLCQVSCKDDLVSDAAEYQGNLIDEIKILSEANKSYVPPSVLAPNSGSSKPSPSLQTPTARPVIPPGFGNTNVLGNSTFKPDTKVETTEMNSKMVHGTVNSSVEKPSGERTVKQLVNQSHLNINNNAGGFDLLVNGKGIDPYKGPTQYDIAVSNQNFSTPLLEHIFGNSLTADGGGLSILAEDVDGSLIDKWKGGTVESSKFAHWFNEDDGMGLEDGVVSENPVDLLSLMGGGSTSKVIPVYPKSAKCTDTTVPVLTCEDFEQSILSQMSQHEVPSDAPLGGLESHNENAAQPKASIDALASQHLLSVLQKGPVPNDIDPSLDLSKGSISMDVASHSLEQQKNKVSVMGKNPTLEAIFGSAFMKELQASDAPVSTKRDSHSDSSRFRFPGDEILTTGGNHLNPSNSFQAPVDAVNNSGHAPSNLPLSAIFRDGRPVRHSQDNQVIPRDSFGTMDYNNMYHNIRAHSSPPQLPTQHTSSGLPMFNQQEAYHHHHPPQIRFPDNMIRHDPPAVHQFSPSHQMFNQPRPIGLESLSQPPMMQQGSADPSHLLRQYSGNLPQSPHPYSQVHGFGQELNRLQGFHIGHQQPSFHGPGMPTPDPELLQRVMDLEFRSNPKPNHPLAGHLGRQ